MIQFGGVAFDGGTLRIKFPVAKSLFPHQLLSIGRKTGCWIEVYEATRKFHDLSQDECQVFVDRLMNDLRSIVNKLEEINELDPPEAIADSVLDLDGIVGSLIDNGDEFLRHRIGWEDFALSLEEAVEDLQPADVDGTIDVFVDLHKAAAIVSAALKEIDSGNQKEAETAANRAVQETVQLPSVKSLDQLLPQSWVGRERRGPRFRLFLWGHAATLSSEFAIFLPNAAIRLCTARRAAFARAQFLGSSLRPFDKAQGRQAQARESRAIQSSRQPSTPLP